MEGEGAPSFELIDLMYTQLYLYVAITVYKCIKKIR